MDALELEGIARGVHDQTGIEAPVDAFDIAAAMEIVCKPWMRADGARAGDVVRFPSMARDARQHGTVAHELGHWLLDFHGHDARDERAARYLAGALMLPRQRFLRDCAATDYDLDELQRIHVHASAEMIVVRMTQVSAATAWVWDNAKLARVYGVPSDDDSIAALVDRVLTLEEPCRDGRLSAWPRIDGRWRRVLVVARAA